MTSNNSIILYNWLRLVEDRMDIMIGKRFWKRTFVQVKQKLKKDICSCFSKYATIIIRWTKLKPICP